MELPPPKPHPNRNGGVFVPRRSALPIIEAAEEAALRPGRAATALRCGWSAYYGVQSITPPKFNIAPENRESQKETHLPTIHFQGLC